MSADEDAVLTPAMFDGMTLTSEEQAKVDMLKTKWALNPAPALPSLRRGRFDCGRSAPRSGVAEPPSPLDRANYWGFA